MNTQLSCLVVFLTFVSLTYSCSNFAKSQYVYANVGSWKFGAANERCLLEHVKREFNR